METKREEFRGHFATPSQEPSRGRFGWVLGGFRRIFGGTWRDAKRRRRVLWWRVRRMFGRLRDAFVAVPERSGEVARDFGEDFF